MLLLGMPREQADWFPWNNDIRYLVLQMNVHLTEETAMARIEKQASCWSLMVTWTRFWDATDIIGSDGRMSPNARIVKLESI